MTPCSLLSPRLFDVARTLHDSLDSLSVEDERRQIAKLICRFIDKVRNGGEPCCAGCCHQQVCPRVMARSTSAVTWSSS